MLTTLLVIASFHANTVQVPTWSDLQAPYAYHHLDFSQVRETPEASEGQTSIRFTFPSPTGDTVYGVLVEPRGAHNVPCVVLLHGLGNSKKEMVAAFGPALIAKGIAYAAIDAPGHGERKNALDRKAQQDITGVFLTTHVRGDLVKAIMNSPYKTEVFGYLTRAVVGGVVDERHLLDYVTSRREIDHDHVALWGLSMGSIMSTILGGVDNRPACALLMVGGDPVLPMLSQLAPEERRVAIATCCSLYAPHFGARPVRMLSGTHDTVIPRDATDRLYEAFPEKWRSISWYNSDHFLPALASEEAVGWIARQSGKVALSGTPREAPWSARRSVSPRLVGEISLTVR